MKVMSNSGSDQSPVGSSGWLNRRASLLVAAPLTLLLLWYTFSSQKSTSGGDYRTAPVERGDLSIAINATGTVEPEEVVDIGAQVAGRILVFGKDLQGKFIDYGSEVDEGTILAQIDDSLYKADAVQAQAALDRARATQMQAQAKLMQAERDWIRAKNLGPGKVIAQSSYDAYETTFLTAQAEVALAKSDVAQAEAGLVRTKQNLEYCTIKSPVRGIIIDRRVNIGQTVVSSLNAPSLFLIAKDLSKMQVWVAVNEADIGSITPGQTVRFTVDARPGDQFVGKVRKVRLNASMNQNVVTYIVEVETDNPDRRLLPYLTANVKFQVGDYRSVLLVPNAALRWSPADAAAASKQSLPADQGASEQGQVWLLSNGAPKAVAVRILGSEGGVSAVESSDLAEGATVIVSQSSEGGGQTASGAGNVNPFAPVMGRGRRGR
jgi:HlyD family secretion protein